MTKYTPMLVARTPFCRDTVVKNLFVTNTFRLTVPTFEPPVLIEFLHVNAYPNPTDGLLTLDILMSKEVDVDLRVVDVLGRVQLQRRLTEALEYQPRLDLSGLAPGVYVVHLRAGNRVYGMEVAVF